MELERGQSSFSEKACYNLARNWSGYDMETFGGRLGHFFEVCEPLKSFYSCESLRQLQRELKAIEIRADKEGNYMLSYEEY